MKRIFSRTYNTKPSARPWPLTIEINAEGAEAEVRIIGEISDWHSNSEDLRRQVDALIQQGVRNLKVYLKGPGGDCFEADEMINILRAFPGTKRAVGGSIVASAHTKIAAEMDSFELAKNAKFMIHYPWCWTVGNSRELRNTLGLMESFDQDYIRAYSDKTGMSPEEVKAMLDQGDQWLNADRALELGFADSITGEEQIEENEQARIDSSLQSQPRRALVQHRMAALSTPSIQSNSNNKSSDMDTKILAARLGLPSTASDADCEAAIRDLNAAKAERDQIKAERDAEKKVSNKAKITSLLDDAVTSKRITASNRGEWETLLEADFEKYSAKLKELQPAATVATTTTPTPEGSAAIPQGREAWNYDKWASEDPDGLRAMHKNNYAEFNKLYNAKYGRDAMKLA